MYRFKYRNSWLVVCVLVFLPVMAQGQTGSVTIKAAVSEIVALSVSPEFSPDNSGIESHSEGSSVVLTLTGSGAEVLAVRVPLLVRSNTDYKISALVQSQAATLSNLAVLDARATGRFVSPDAVANLNLAGKLERLATNGSGQTVAPNSLFSNPSAPLSVLGGPRVSLAGTLKSRDNALAFTLLIAVKPEGGAGGWRLRLILSGSAAR